MLSIPNRLLDGKLEPAACGESGSGSGGTCSLLTKAHTAGSVSRTRRPNVRPQAMASRAVAAVAKEARTLPPLGADLQVVPLIEVVCGLAYSVPTFEADIGLHDVIADHGRS